ncbi:PepSY-associated TM helix domain-containing protein [Phenylobacterium sp.]|uniref:PepSY-associated TM helix domain-containing protein n=1 Tax=Phenylobacterium sp. TaxID=1871053 RepID=UPI002FDAC6D0
MSGGGVNGALRQSMAWLHTWSGLLVGWILFAMFMTGTASYFRPEITRWMEPETGPPAGYLRAAEGAVSALSARAPQAESWSIVLPDERRSTATAAWRNPRLPDQERPRKRGENRVVIDAGSGEVITPRETRGGEFFYRVHFQLHYLPVLWGRIGAGICAMFMLAAIVSGVITHKRIFKDIFTFRPTKAAQRSWLDAHNLTAVLALPFHVMITYSGLVTLMLLYMPWGVQANYPTAEAFYAEAFPQDEAPPPSGIRAPLADLTTVLQTASEHWGGGRPWIVNINHPGDAKARIQVTRHSGDRLTYDNGALTFDGVTGALLSETPKPGPAVTTHRVIYGLHMGRFADPLLRWIYFLCSLAGCAMVATGLVLWTVKRRQQLPDPDRPHLGFRVVERLNIGTIAGVPAAMAATLWANRLLPAHMSGRGEWEIHAFFITWASMIVLASLRPPRRAWVESLSLAALLVAALPLLSAATSPRNIWANATQGDWGMVTFDVTLILLGAGLGACAAKAQAWRGAAPRLRRPRTAEQVS